MTQMRCGLHRKLLNGKDLLGHNMLWLSSIKNVAVFATFVFLVHMQPYHNANWLCCTHVCIMCFRTRNCSTPGMICSMAPELTSTRGFLSCPLKEKMSCMMLPGIYMQFKIVKLLLAFISIHYGLTKSMCSTKTVMGNNVTWHYPQPLLYSHTRYTCIRIWIFFAGILAVCTHV